ncbi:MAG: Helix-turn-helix domain [Pseudomonadota bacterium]|jgi:biotin operon repressor
MSSLAINGFTLTHASLNAAQGISPIERLVLATLSSFANFLSECWPSNQTLADKTGLNERTVRRQIESLQKKGLIERKSRGQGRAMLTRILINPNAKTPDIVPPTPDIVPPYEPNKNLNQITAAAVAPLPETATAAIVVSEQIPELPIIPNVEVSFGPLEPLQRVVDTNPLPEVAQAPVEPSMALMTEPMAQETVTEPAKVTIDPPVEAPADPLAEVPATLLADLGEVRKAKKKPAKVTRTEAQILAQEAAKAGLSVKDVILLMVLRGWSRFEASWIPHVPPQAVVQGPQSVFVPEVVKPASPGAIARFKEVWAKQRAEMVANAAQRRLDRAAAQNA